MMRLPLSKVYKFGHVRDRIGTYFYEQLSCEHCRIVWPSVGLTPDATCFDAMLAGNWKLGKTYTLCNRCRRRPDVRFVYLFDAIGHRLDPLAQTIAVAMVIVYFGLLVALFIVWAIKNLTA